MAYYLDWSGTNQYTHSATLGDLAAITTFRIECDNYTPDGGYWFSQAGSTTSSRTIGFWDNANIVYFGSNTLIGTALSGNGNYAFELDFTTDAYTIEKDGVVIASGTAAKGAGGNESWLGQFRIGARGDTSSTTDGSGAFISGANNQVGDTRVYIDGVLVRNYVSDGTGSTWEESVAANDGTLVNFPTDDSQWVFYDDGGAVTGTGDSVSGPSTSSGSGTGVTIGSGASVSQPSSSSGTGTGVTTGSGASVSGPSTSAGTGLRVITGSGDSISGPSTSSGTGGTGSAVVTGSGDSQSGPATSSGTGTGVTTGSGASVSGPSTSTGVALRVITGSGSSQSGPATSSGTGGSVRVVTGSGNSVSGPSTSTGVGLRVITGSGSSVSGPATSDGSDRGALARPVIKPGSIDIAPKYASIDIAPKYGTTDY